MKKLMAFFLGLVAVISLTSCAAVTDLTVETTRWEMGMARNFLGGGSSAESNIKQSNTEDAVSNNIISPDNKKKKFVVGNSTK